METTTLDQQRRRAQYKWLAFMGLAVAALLGWWATASAPWTDTAASPLTQPASSENAAASVTPANQASTNSVQTSAPSVSPPADSAAGDTDADEKEPDPYEITESTSPTPDDGTAHSIRSELKTGADLDYEAGLIDDFGNPTTVEVGSPEDEAALRAALADEAAHMPAASGGDSCAPKSATTKTAACAKRR